MKEGCKIKVFNHRFGDSEDLIVEKFRHCLGVFLSPAHREAGDFTPLCELYEPGAGSEQRYIANYGEYFTNQVPAWADLPAD